MIRSIRKDLNLCTSGGINMSSEQACSALLDSPVGLLRVHTYGDCLTGVEFLGHSKSVHDQNPDVSIEAIRVSLSEYFDSGIIKNNIKKMLQGTEYQRKVWDILESIPPGQTRTYGEIAHLLGSSPRAVGNACRKNPVPIFVPCHRVVAAHGAGGFMGKTSGSPLAIKRWLLEHEQNCR